MRTSKSFTGLLPTPQAIDGSGEGRPLRLKKDCNRDPNQPGSWRGDLKDHIAQMNMTSTYSQPHHPAKPQAQPESEREQMTPGGSGQKLLESLEKSDLVGSSLRTFTASLVLRGDWRSTRCALTWKLKATKSGRSFCQLQVSRLPTRDTGSGLSGGGLMNQKLARTPAASDGVGGAKVGPKYLEAESPKFKLRDQVANLLHTPRSVMIEETPENFRRRMNSKRLNDRKNGLPNLAVQVANLIPTVRTSSKNGSSQSEREHGNPKKRLECEVEMLDSPQEVSGTETGEQSPTRPAGRMRLSPEFTEWMIGLPMGYTSLASQYQKPSTEQNA